MTEKALLDFLLTAYRTPTVMTHRSKIILSLMLLLFPSQVILAQAPDQKPATSVVPETMKKAYGAFKALQPFISDRNSFAAPENEPEIIKNLEKLQANFHSLDKKRTGYESDPTFETSLELAEELIDSSLVRFKQGNKRWVLWRLRTLSSHCYSCHATHEIDAGFHDEETEKNLPEDEYIRGEFYLASRQFDKASRAFLRAAVDESEETETLDALRKWLTITTRIQADPKVAIRQLKQVVQLTSLTAHEVETIKAWLVSLTRWLKEKPSDLSQLEKAELLITESAEPDDPAFEAGGTVELLRASGMLHRRLDESGLSKEEHRKSLYLLGLAYSKMPQFFINELPEVYLEQVIRAYPGSEEAKKAHKLYYDIIVDGFTGSSGTNIPDDVQAKLDFLEKLSRGETVKKQETAETDTLEDTTGQDLEKPAEQDASEAPGQR